jgi:type II secretory pathway pseudopilin PulG
MRTGEARSMPCAGRPPRKQAGFTYLAILFVVAIAGIMLAQAGLNWSHASQREKEAELLFVGSEYRKAIMLYYERTPGPVKKYPAKLEDLLLDTRYASPQRYLRKLYRDPFTGRAEWGLVMAPEGGIMGVHSPSTAAPIKMANFSYADASFEGAGRYTDWVFSYVPLLISPRQ